MYYLWLNQLCNCRTITKHSNCSSSAANWATIYTATNEVETHNKFCYCYFCCCCCAWFVLFAQPQQHKQKAYYDYGQKYDTLSHNALRFMFTVSAAKVEVTMSHPKVPRDPPSIDPCWRRAEINKYIYTQVIQPIFHPPPFAMSCKRIRTVSLMLYLPLALFLFWFLCFFFGACTVYFYCRLARCCHIYGAVWQRQTRTFVIWTTSWQLAANADAAASCRQTARLR